MFLSRFESISSLQRSPFNYRFKVLCVLHTPTTAASSRLTPRSAPRRGAADGAWVRPPPRHVPERARGPADGRDDVPRGHTHPPREDVPRDVPQLGDTRHGRALRDHRQTDSRGGSRGHDDRNRTIALLFDIIKISLSLFSFLFFFHCVCV